jgi:hypothetical protein
VRADANLNAGLDFKVRAPEIRVEAPRVRADANLNAGLDFNVRAPEIRVEAPRVHADANLNAGLNIHLGAPSIQYSAEDEAFRREYARIQLALKKDIKVRMNYTAEFNRDLARVKFLMKRGISERFLMKHRLTKAHIDGDLNLGLERINRGFKGGASVNVQVSGGVDTSAWNAGFARDFAVV